MRNRRAAQEQVADVARRRLELLSAELAGIGGRTPDASRSGEPAGSKDAAVSMGAAVPVVRAGVAPTPERSGTDHAAVEKVPGPGRHAHRALPPSARCAGWLRDRLPPTLQGAVGLSSAHVSVVALLVAGSLALASWWVLRAEADPVVVAPTVARAGELLPVPTVGAENPTTAAPVAGDPGSSPTSAPGMQQAAVVVVDVAGKVRDPGIATLPAGSRVIDAIEAAGGVRRGVDLTTVNLARVLIDGEQILVGVPSPGGVAAPAASAPVGAGGPMVNLNTATQPQLEELPGVGPVTAQAILQWRTEHGAFTAVDELLEVSGIGEATLAELAPFVTL